MGIIAKTAVIANIRTMADGSPRITLDFGEMDAESFAALYRHKISGEIGIIVTSSEMIDDFTELLKQLKDNQSEDV